MLRAWADCQNQPIAETKSGIWKLAAAPAARGWGRETSGPILLTVPDALDPRHFGRGARAVILSQAMRLSRLLDPLLSVEAVAVTALAASVVDVPVLDASAACWLCSA